MKCLKVLAYVYHIVIKEKMELYDSVKINIFFREKINNVIAKIITSTIKKYFLYCYMNVEH